MRPVPVIRAGGGGWRGRSWGSSRTNVAMGVMPPRASWERSPLYQSSHRFNRCLGERVAAQDRGESESVQRRGGRRGQRRARGQRQRPIPAMALAEPFNGMAWTLTEPSRSRMRSDTELWARSPETNRRVSEPSAIVQK